MDELNQVQDAEVEISEPEDDLFSDYEAEETPETSQEETVEETPKSFLRVKYNGEEQDLSEEDARTYAQKGMNYDRIYEPIERLARMNNMNVGDYLNQLNETQIAYEISKEMDSLREDPKYEGVSDEILEEIANSRVNELMGNRFQQEQDEIYAQQQAQQQMVQMEVDKFLNEYPEFRDKGPEALDPKVYDLVKQGYSLLEAYEKFQRTDANARAQKQNEENRKRSLGNTTNAGKVETDDFLKGFLNG